MVLQVGCVWMGPAALGSGNILGGVSCKVPLFSFQSCCAPVLRSTQDQGSCQSSEQRQKEGEESTWGRCPLLSMLLLFTPAQFLKGTLGNQWAGRSHGPLPCPRHRECWCQPIPG